MSIETPGVVNNLEDSNDEVENANECGEPSVKEKRRIFPKRCGTGTINIFILFFFDINAPLFSRTTENYSCLSGSHYLYQHGKKNKQRETKNCN